MYADDTQIYVSFKCDDPSQALDKINVCISDIRRWMTLNKLKINDSKTEFIVFRSLAMLKHDFSDLSVNVGGNLIKADQLDSLKKFCILSENVIFHE